MKNKVELKPCPCGMTPKNLSLKDPCLKWAYACGSCCGEWNIEFRTNYDKLDTAECMELAVNEWNRTPRGEMMKNKVELKPCPFCGKQKIKISQDNSIEPIYFYVGCFICDAEGPWQDTKELAAIKWNTRAFEPEMLTEQEFNRSKIENIQGTGLDIDTSDMPF